MKAGKGKVVLILDEQETERNGLLIPSSSRDKIQKGEVVGIAPDSPDYIKVGLTVFIPEIAGIDLTHEGVDYRAVQLHEIYAYL